MNIQGWFSIGLIGLISLVSKGLSSFLLHQNSKAWILWHYLCSNLHICTWLLDKKYKKCIAWLYRLLLAKQCLCFNMLSRFVIVFLPRKKCLLISKLQSLSTVILVPKNLKYVIASIVSLSIFLEMIGRDAMILVFWMLSFKPAFSLSLFTLNKKSLITLLFLPLEWYHLHIWGCWYFP